MTQDVWSLAPATVPRPKVDATDRWIVFRKPRPLARVRLFCFHHAGGNAMAYRRWVSDLPDWIDVCPVQLPGRGQRIDEPPFIQMQDLVDVFVAQTEPLLDIPVAVFGHSMGAAVAFAVAERLGPAVVHVLAAGRRSPSLASDEALHELDDSGLELYLDRLGATPTIVFEDPELRAHVLEVLRADLTLNDSYRAIRPLAAVPLTVLGGSEDQEVPPHALDAWRALTRGEFRQVMFPAEHFFTATCREAVQRLVVTSLQSFA
jgi:medium-chain acyl-[acyl-carrier-protein] hydrolase